LFILAWITAPHISCIARKNSVVVKRRKLDSRASHANSSSRDNSPVSSKDSNPVSSRGSNSSKDNNSLGSSSKDSNSLGSSSSSKDNSSPVSSSKDNSNRQTASARRSSGDATSSVQPSASVSKRRRRACAKNTLRHWSAMAERPSNMAMSLESTPGSWRKQIDWHESERPDATGPREEDQAEAALAVVPEAVLLGLDIASHIVNHSRSHTVSHSHSPIANRSQRLASPPRTTPKPGGSARQRRRPIA